MVMMLIVGVCADAASVRYIQLHQFSDMKVFHDEAERLGRMCISLILGPCKLLS